MKPVLHNSILFIVIALLGSCSLMRTKGPSHAKSSDYHLSSPSSDWEKSWTTLPPHQSDKAYLHHNSGSIILINSICDRYQETSLQFLSQNLLSGLNVSEVKERKEFTLAGMPAMSLKAKGKMDDVEIYISAITNKRTKCVFDFILIIQNEKHYKADLKDFESLINSISFGDEK